MKPSSQINAKLSRRINKKYRKPIRRAEMMKVRRPGLWIEFAREATRKLKVENI